MSTATGSTTTSRVPINNGLFYGASAYFLWGIMPLYLRPLSGKVGPLLILSHRVIWSVVLLVGFLTVLRQWGAVWAAVRNRRTLGLLVLSTVMISSNWYMFTYVTTSGQVIQASLGYFLNPLFSAALGVLFMKERLRRWQWVAVSVAAAGIAYLSFGMGTVPTLALLLALTFGVYGLLRKIVAVDAVAGLAVETAILFPLAIWYLYHAATHAEISNGRPDRGMLIYLAIGCGLFTTIPLLLFAKAARKLKLSTLGFMQYIGPTCQFLLAVVFFGESFSHERQVAFGLVWVAVAIFLIDSLVHHTRGQTSIPVEEPT